MRHGRLEWLSPADLDPEQQALYDSIVGGARGKEPQAFSLVDDLGRLQGPFNAMLVAPIVGHALQQLGSAIRFGTSLSTRAREIAILSVARAESSEFEWFAHQAVGRTIGLTESELDALRAREPSESFDATEREVFAVVDELLSTGDLSERRHDEALETLGVTLLVELVTLVGYYRCLSLALRVWRVPLPAGVAPVFTDVAPGSPAQEI